MRENADATQTGFDTCFPMAANVRAPRDHQEVLSAVEIKHAISKAHRLRAGDLDPSLPYPQAHRIKHLDAVHGYILRHAGVMMWTGAEILDWGRLQNR